MYADNLSAIAEALGLERTGSVYLGFVDGWPVHAAGSGNAILVTVNTSEERISSVYGQLNKLLKPYRVGANWRGRELRIIFTARLREKNADEVLRECLALLTQNGLRPYDVCPLRKS